MEFCRQEYWCWLPFLPPGDLPDPGIELQSPGSPASQADSSSAKPLEKEMATHSSVLAWIISGTGEPDGLPSMGSHRVGHD